MWDDLPVKRFIIHMVSGVLMILSTGFFVKEGKWLLAGWTCVIIGTLSIYISFWVWDVEPCAITRVLRWIVTLFYFVPALYLCLALSSFVTGVPISWRLIQVVYQLFLHYFHFCK